MADNFFKLYKLDPMNDTYTVEDYKKKIAAMVAEWTKKEKKPDTSESSRRKFSELIADAKEHEGRCSDTIFIEVQRKEAKTMLVADISKFAIPMAVVCSDDVSVIKEGNLDDLCARLKTSWPFINNKNVQKYLDLIGLQIGKSIGNTPIAYKNLYKSLGEDYGGSIVKWINHVSTLTVLRITGLRSVTEESSFADISYDINTIHKRLISITDLEKYKDVSAAALKNDIQLIKPITVDEKKYREYLRYVKVSNNIPVFERYIDENSGSMTNPAIVKSLIEKINRTECNSTDMVVALENYCLMKNIPANFSNKELNFIACGFCGGLTSVGKDTIKCSICGSDLFVRCPNCGTKISSMAISCTKCGFNLKEALENARLNEQIFEDNLSNGYPELALVALNDIRSQYSGYPELRNLEKRYELIGAPLTNLMKKAKAEEKDKKFYSLNMTCKKALQYAPKSLELKNMRDTANNAVTNANKLIAGAAVMDNAAKQAAYVRAGQICSDHPEVINFFSSFPPMKPSELKCIVKDASVILRIMPSSEMDEFTSFILLKKEGSASIGPNDGTVIMAGNSTTYVDKDICSGVDTYYSAYTKRWDLHSRASASFGPVSLFADVLNASASPIDNGVRISYDLPNGCDRVHIWRKEGSPIDSPGDGTRIYSGLNDQFDDRDLELGKTYHYLVIAEYSKNRVKSANSLGVCLSCSPVSIPDPIDDLVISSVGAEYEASWSGNSNCSLYISNEDLNIHGAVDLHDLALRRIVSKTIDSNHASFALEQNTVAYVYPVILLGNTAIVGRPKHISTLPDINSLDMTQSGDDCILTFNWPNGCNNVIISVKESSYSNGIDDSDAKIIRVPKRTYDQDRKVIIPVKGLRLVHITIYSEFSKGHSNGYRFIVNAGTRIDLEYEIKKGLFGPQYLEIKTDSVVKEIPAFVIVSSSGFIPRLKTSGETVIRVGDIAVNNGRVKINLDKKLDLKHIKYRLFFENEDSYSTFAVMHPK